MYYHHTPRDPSRFKETLKFSLAVLLIIALIGTITVKFVQFLLLLLSS